MAEEYRFNIGALEQGVGLAFTVVADDPEQAVALIGKHLPEQIEIRDFGAIRDLVLYVEHEFIKPTDLGDAMDGYYCSGCGQDQGSDEPCFYDDDECPLCLKCHLEDER